MSQHDTKAACYPIRYLVHVVVTRHLASDWATTLRHVLSYLSSYMKMKIEVIALATCLIPSVLALPAGLEGVNQEQLQAFIKKLQQCPESAPCEPDDSLFFENDDELAELLNMMQDGSGWDSDIEASHKEAPQDIHEQKSPFGLDLINDWLPFQKYIEFAEGDWRDLKTPLHDNPLLKLPSEGQKRETALLADRVDPSIKLGADSQMEWHLRDASWRKRFWEAAVKLRDYIYTHGSMTIDDFFAVLGPWRGFVKLESDLRVTNSPDFDNIRKFGEKSIDHPATYVADRYEELLVRDGETTTEFFEKLITEQSYEFSEVDLKSHTEIPELTVTGNQLDFFVEMKPPGEHPIRLTKLSLDFSDYLMMYFRWTVNSPLMKSQYLRDYFEKSMGDVFAAAQDPAIDLEEFSELVGKMHWLISNTSPFRRGSASIADLMTATAYLMKGYQFPGWKLRVSADVTALCMPDLKLYMATFLSLMDGKPLPLS